MNIYTLLSIVLTLAAIIGFINARYIHLPTTIAIMMGSLILSLLVLIVGKFGFNDVEQAIYEQFSHLSFQNLLMQGMLSFLLFAGALSVNLNFLKQRKWEIIILSSLGTIFSALIVALLCYFISPLVGFSIPFIYCLLFGALISPTDPIAVLAIFKQLGAPKSLHVTVAGESLFNDGVGIVLFITIFNIATHGASTTWHSVLLLFLQQSVGGIIFGVILGLAGLWFISQIDEYQVEILITLAMATGGYILADALGLSGPLAMVSAGIVVGNRGRALSMSKKTRRNLDNFWELIDEILNAVLFLLIGLELLVITHAAEHTLYLSLLAIPIVLLARYIIVAVPMRLFMLRKQYAPLFINILVWGGLRGGLAVALALSLPESSYRPVILAMTYAVVVFAIIVQGITVKPLVKMSSDRQKNLSQG